MRIEPMQAGLYNSSLEGLNKRGAAIENLVDKVFEKNDSDEDGALSVAELGISDEKFSRIDANSDGLIGVEEMIKPLQALDMMATQGAKDFNRGNRLEKKSAKVIENRDADGDGALNIDEFGRSQELFSFLDSNEDELVDQDELMKGAKNSHQGNRLENMSSNIIENMDTDGDGALNIEELGSSQELFSFLDSNEDDLVDQDELMEGIQALKAGAEKQAGKVSEEDSEEDSDEVEIIGNGIDDDGDGEIDEVDSNSVFSSSYSAADLLPSANSSETEDEEITHVDIIA